ncbi:MAG: LamG domain-containing protein [archaeon]
MNKGQITTIDFLISMALVIFCVGAIMGFAELQTYKIKSEIKENALVEKADAALIVLASGTETGCLLGDHNLAYSFNTSVANMSDAELKKIFGIGANEDYNLELKVGETTIISEQLNGKNIIATDINLLVCNNPNISGPISLWRLNNNTNDSNIQTMNNLLSNTANWVTGKDGNALKFNGANDYAEKPNASKLPLGNGARTIALWIKPKIVGTDQGIIGYGNSGEVFAIIISANKWALFTGTNTSTFGNPIITEKWYQIVLTYGGGNDVNTYVNGEFKQTVSLGGIPLNTANSNLTIGRFTTSTDKYFNGTLDEISIWSRALSQEEIRTLYLANLYEVTREKAVLKVSG